MKYKHLFRSFLNKERFDREENYISMPGPGSYELDQSSIERRLNTSYNKSRAATRADKTRSAKGISRNNLNVKTDMTFTAGFAHGKSRNINTVNTSMVIVNNGRDSYILNSQFQTQKVGPGDYHTNVNWLEKSYLVKRKNEYDKMKHNEGPKVFKSTCSIPSRKIKNQNFTGVGNDKPGPNSYQPDLNPIKRSQNFAPFCKLKSDRKGMSQTVSEIGPGQYNALYKAKKNFHVTGASSMFLSKVKRSEHTSKKRKSKKNGTNTSSNKNILTDYETGIDEIKNQIRSQLFSRDCGFMSATKREGQWLNKIDNPYTKQYSKLRPTFAMLLQEKQQRIEEIRGKKKQGSKNNIVNAPFNIQASRNYEYAADTLGPGPGSYIDVNDPKYSSINHKNTVYGNPQVAALKKANLPNNFGSSIDRFDNPDYKKCVETPGPGAYEGKSQNTQETRSQSNEKPRKGQFFFNSKTNRFLYDTEDKKKSDDTDKSLTVQFNNDMSLSLIQHRSNSVEAEIRRNYADMEKKDPAPFGSNIPRFMFKQVFFGEDLKLTPGPGYYAKEVADE